jgi:hypothetical protein
MGPEAEAVSGVQSSIEESIQSIEDASIVIQSNTSTTCYVCEKQPSSDDLFCSNCGYPLQGTEDEQNDFVSNWNFKHFELEEMNRKVQKATNSLYVLAGLSFISAFIFYGIASEGSNPMPVVITTFILSTIFLGLAFWSKKQPVAAIISGLSLYLIVQILGMIEDPWSLFSGAIVKVFIIIFLLKGLRSAFDAQKIKKQLNLD